MELPELLLFQREASQTWEEILQSVPCSKCPLFDPTLLTRINPLPDPVPPITALARLSGANRGIQGASNSCYLDTLLFSMFAFDSLFEEKLRRCEDESSDAKETLWLLFEEIINPLRKNLFLPAEPIRRLRKMLANKSKETAFLNKSRDIPECMDVLFQKLVKMEQFVVTG